MQVRTLQRIGVVLKDWRKAPVPVCLCVGFFLLAEPADAQPVATVVSASDQSARDDERLRILRDELRKSEALVETLAKRKAERLAVADKVAADEAEEGRLRTLGDIAALQREIAGTRPSADAPAKAAPPASGSHPVPARPAQPKPPPVTPWWDVYGKARRTATPAPVSYAQPPGNAAASTDSTRRME
ncbi:hypothetical protein [Variovorax fucosicus]|uniref:hypothetical protein n=1 Tax=Variovorax fucosicus TaxID=3053517 RepID=UPI00257880E4|nr:hypothetical protein [Variovorax sp. J22G47]MDM0058978.1 hypothetical protein [Variovorax sp. J22G47]